MPCSICRIVVPFALYICTVCYLVVEYSGPLWSLNAAYKIDKPLNEVALNI